MHVGCSFLPWLSVRHLRFLHNRSNWSPSFSSFKFQNSDGISYLLSYVSNFQHQKNGTLRSISLLCSLNLSPICLWRESSCWMLFFSMTILDFISRVHVASFVITIHKYLKHSSFSGCFWSITTCTENIGLEIHITLDISSFFSIKYHLTI